MKLLIIAVLSCAVLTGCNTTPKNTNTTSEPLLILNAPSNGNSQAAAISSREPDATLCG